jgi:hypothetical protein
MLVGTTNKWLSRIITACGKIAQIVNNGGQAAMSLSGVRVRPCEPRDGEPSNVDEVDLQRIEWLRSTIGQTETALAEPQPMPEPPPPTDINTQFGLTPNAKARPRFNAQGGEIKYNDALSMRPLGQTKCFTRIVAAPRPARDPRLELSLRNDLDKYQTELDSLVQRIGG